MTIVVAVASSSVKSMAPASLLYASWAGADSVYVESWGEPFTVYVANADPQLGPPRRAVLWRNAGLLVGVSAWAGLVAGVNVWLGVSWISFGKSRRWFTCESGSGRRQVEVFWRSCAVLVPVVLIFAFFGGQQVLAWGLTVCWLIWAAGILVGSLCFGAIARLVNVAGRPLRGAAVGGAVGLTVAIACVASLVGLGEGIWFWAGIATLAGAMHGAMVALPRRP